ncbi:glycosyltransferase family 1 protein [Sphingomonas piscis]|uniref:Glycosyltransferase family 1 protein n=2 Tax=Sphingomonas piscis TaxID=2714943 RepID=A0A6G7YQ78_9SPHN|nr:glycosyltransferase family 1 protein [Sphingomonas piscis]
MLTGVRVPVESLTRVAAPDPEPVTLLCFSHLRWNFVFQRPQHLMSRFAEEMKVIYWEEPIVIAPGETAFVQVRQAEDFPDVTVAVPHLPEGLSMPEAEATLTRLATNYAASLKGALVKWYYTPMMLPFSRQIEADTIVYDCMDELSQFKFAPPMLLELEQELIDSADLVFTGGSSLFEAKKDRHSSVHLFPSSVDRDHFALARSGATDPQDQANLARPRLGFYGVIDERFDIDLLRQMADARPNWQFVMVGPVVKISDEDLPRAANIHYVGGKTYEQLPHYLSGWDVALMPFAINEATRFISPTKTPEYLAGGKPVVSTPIRDVVRHYGHLQGVQIAYDADGFVAACEKALELAKDPKGQWLAEADLLLSATSWDTTQARMSGLIHDVLGERTGVQQNMLVAAE